MVTKFVISLDADEEKAILVEEEVEGGRTFILTFANVKEEEEVCEVVGCDLFQRFTLRYIRKNRFTATLTSVNIKFLEKFEEKISTIFLEATVEEGIDGTKPLTQSIVLKPYDPLGLLIIIRATKKEENGNFSSRDFVLFSSNTRTTIGQKAHVEIVSAKYSAQGYISGTCTNYINDLLNIEIHRSHLITLTDRFLFSAPDRLHDGIKLLLFRISMTSDEFRILKDKAPPCIKLSALGEAWRITSDAKSLSALFLFHEFRYHGIMPRYRPPLAQDMKITNTRYKTKSTAFNTIGTLEPQGRYINLKVKVIEELDRCIKKDCILVGDQTGTIYLKVQEKLDILGVVANNLVISNSYIYMDDSNMYLKLDKYGKISSPSEEELDDFKFEVNMANNVSNIEYELVGSQSDIVPIRGNSRGRRGDYRNTRRGGSSRGRFRNSRYLSEVAPQSALNRSRMMTRNNNNSRGGGGGGYNRGRRAYERIH